MLPVVSVTIQTSWQDTPGQGNFKKNECAQPGKDFKSGQNFDEDGACLLRCSRPWCMLGWFSEYSGNYEVLTNRRTWQRGHQQSCLAIDTTLPEQKKYPDLYGDKLIRQCTELLSSFVRITRKHGTTSIFRLDGLLMEIMLTSCAVTCSHRARLVIFRFGIACRYAASRRGYPSAFISLMHDFESAHDLFQQCAWWKTLRNMVDWNSTTSLD